MRSSPKCTGTLASGCIRTWIVGSPCGEAARLQSFHDGFVFVGSEWQQLKQIGNAVPPLLAYALAKTAKGVLRRLVKAKPSKANVARPAASQPSLPFTLA